jgi:lysophospholipase L1-like esterase
MSRRLALVLLSFRLLVPFSDAYSQQRGHDHWVATWATANLARSNLGQPSFSTGTTYRQILRTSLPGDRVQVEFSNEFGIEPLIIGPAQIGLSKVVSGSTAVNMPTRAHALTFKNSRSVCIAAGGTAVSDPVTFKLGASSDLEVTLFVPNQIISTITWHDSAHTTSWMGSGNSVGIRQPGVADTSRHFQNDTSWFFLKSVDVETAGDTGVIVAFGDSLTNGAGSTLDAHAAWPSILAARFQANASTRNLAIVNEGIGGNRVLRDGVGLSALSRLDNDALTLAGVKALILFEGINDIGRATDLSNPGEAITSDELIQGLRKLIQRVHSKGLRVYAVTLTPYGGSRLYSEAGEAMRESVNRWIRSTDLVDGVLDFAAAVEDPSHPEMYLPAYDSGDHLHPSDDGYRAMANSIGLWSFRF